MVTDYKFETLPFEHQEKAFAISRDKKAFALLMEQGTGKSKVLIDTAAYLWENGKIHSVVVIAPKSVCRNWAQKEVPTHLPKRIDRLIGVWSAAPKKAEQAALDELMEFKPLSLRWFIMNAEAVATEKGARFLHRFLVTYQCLLVLDESTLFKNPKAARVKALSKVAHLATYRRILTGTPVANRPLDVFSQFELMAPGCLDHSSFYSFKHRYGVVKKMYAPQGHSFEAIVGYQRLPELFHHIDRVSFRVLKEQCLDLPEKIYQTRYVDLSDEQTRVYNSLADRAVVELQDQVITAPLVLTKLLRLRQTLCNIMPTEDGSGTIQVSTSDPRLEELMQILNETAGKAIIWCNFIPAIVRLRETIGKAFGADSVGAFHGTVDADDRQKLVDAFQDKENKLRFLVMQPRTGGYGLTLTEAQTVVYYDNDWSLEVRQQSEDRAHRIGQKKSVTYIDLVASGTVDELIVGSLKEKKDLASQVTGDKWRDIFKRK